MTLYNPHLTPKHELIETFVVRQRLLDELVDDLRRGGKQHHLLVGGRGSGKTTVLLRLAYAIEDDPKLAKRFVALRFPEEQYNVGTESDFWMNAIDALIDALGPTQPEMTAKLQRQLNDLETLPPAERSKQALALLADWTATTKRSLVLLVDNFDLILDRLEDNHWALREALSENNGLVLVGASSQPIAGTFLYESAFYDFFRVHDLAALDESEARRLFIALARSARTPRAIEMLERDPGRFKAMFVLAGGSARTITLLRAVVATADDMERDLDALLDHVTPYYKARFDELPAQGQIVVDAVASHWHPMTAGECSKQTNLPVNVVSAQLDRLVKAGVLAKVAVADKKLGFQLAERFFNIWYLMRASRRLRTKLLSFVEFLRVFYGDADPAESPQDDKTRERVANALRKGSDVAAIWPVLLELCRRAIATRTSKDILQLLDDTGTTDRFMPLAEALHAIDDPARLDRLAPEVRTAVRDVMVALTTPPRKPKSKREK